MTGNPFQRGQQGEHKRLGWYGHIERMQDTRIFKAIHAWKHISKRPTGRAQKARMVWSYRKNARYKNFQSNTCLETHFKEANGETKDMLGG